MKCGANIMRGPQEKKNPKVIPLGVLTGQFMSGVFLFLMHFLSYYTIAK